MYNSARVCCVIKAQKCIKLLKYENIIWKFEKIVAKNFKAIKSMRRTQVYSLLKN